MATHVELRRCIKVLSEYVSVSRRQRLEEIARSKCHNIAVLLENVVDTGNENAVARTMDGLGFHRMYRLRTNPILLNPSSKLNKLQRTDAGARKWLGVHTINKFDDCIEAIKRDGYRLACALPDAKDSIYSIDLKQKTVFAFGNETSGVSESLKKASDIRFSLPMHGFVESYNVSVAAAITLFHAYTEIRKAKVTFV